MGCGGMCDGMGCGGMGCGGMCDGMGCGGMGCDGMGCGGMGCGGMGCGGPITGGAPDGTSAAVRTSAAVLAAAPSLRGKHARGPTLGGGGIAAAAAAAAPGEPKPTDRGEAGNRGLPHELPPPCDDEPETLPPGPPPYAEPCNACAIFIFWTAACRIESTCSRSPAGIASICMHAHHAKHT